MIKRDLNQTVSKRLEDNKAIIILGARQVGKTTFLANLLRNQDHLFIDGDDPLTIDLLTNANTETLRRIIGSNKIVFFDEAQRIPNIGLLTKIIIDQIKNVKVYISGSSALDISESINEPLTGRKWEYNLFPFSWNELVNHFDFLKMQQQLDQRLVFGNYPDVVLNQGDEEEYLKQLVSSYLYKDVLKMAGIRKPVVLDKLLKMLAFQVGNEVALNELARALSLDKKTVDSYIQLLEKTFIVFRLQSFGRNPRKEITTKKKIYFYDNGVRNALISNFNPLSLRSDIGALWENFMISERIKYLHYQRISANFYFWRNKQGREVDLIEERGGKIYAFEFKYSPTKRVKIPPSFAALYESDFKVIHKGNFSAFLGG
jgi:predicted AAA+ superfamily ATPase